MVVSPASTACAHAAFDAYEVPCVVSAARPLPVEVPAAPYEELYPYPLPP